MYSGSLLRSHAFTQNPLFPIPRRTPSSKWSGEFLTLPYGMQDIHQTSSIPIDTCISENKQLLYWPLYNHDWKIWQIDWKKMTALVHLSKTRTRTSSGRNTHTFAIGLLLLLMQEAKKSYFGMQRRRATIEAVQYVRFGKLRHPLAPTKPLLRSNRAGMQWLHSPNLPYSEGIGSPEGAIRYLKVM